MTSKISPSDRALRSGKAGNSRGFTAPEVLVVLVIAAIAMAVSIPQANRASSSMRLRAGANEIGFQMELARMKAVSNSTSTRILFSTQNESYRVQIQVGTNWQTIGSVRSLPNGVDLTQAGAVTFDRRGMANGSVDLLLSDPSGEEKRISVSMAGDVSITTPGE